MIKDKIKLLFKKYKIQITNIDNAGNQSEFPKSFVVNIIGTVAIVVGVSIIISLFTFVTVINSNLRYIGNEDTKATEQSIKFLQHEIDSMTKVMEANISYIESIKQVLLSDSVENVDVADIPQEKTNTNIIKPVYHKIEEVDVTILDELHFFPPINGVISSTMDITKQHYGTDIITSMSDVVKSTLDGVVIFAGWTIKTGNVIIISHSNDLLSVYKHNSTLLKSINDRVRAGEAIAIAGNSGELTTGQHLHFELWYKNKPINAVELMTF